MATGESERQWMSTGTLPSVLSESKRQRMSGASLWLFPGRSEKLRKSTEYQYNLGEPPVRVRDNGSLATDSKSPMAPRRERETKEVYGTT